MTAIVLDTETTGINPITSRITEIAIVDYDSGEHLLRSCINPECPIPPEITKITGITDETVANAPVFAALAGDIAMIISSAEVLIGQNPWFDQRMLVAEFARDNVIFIETWPMLICTKRIWDIYEPPTQRHLTNAFKRFVDPAGFPGAHGALADTMACRAVLQAQVKTFGLEGKSWDTFDPEQKTWWGPSNHIVWEGGILRINFGKYKGEPCHAVDRGYWRWLTNQEFPEHVLVMADYMTIVASNIITDSELATWAYGVKL